MPQELQSKERNLFTQVVKNYETKQYKKGLKAADQVLKKNPDHGDTQAMKALILNSQGHKDDAFTLAKEALKCDMKSHLCWHIYGLLYKDAKNFEESLKAFRFALKLDPNSHQIQRDLANLQMQLRDYDGYTQSRKIMLRARPGMRQNWTAVAVAQHLNGKLADAETTLCLYEETLKSTPPPADTEHQQVSLYKNMLMEELGDTERALDHLDAIEKNLYDKLLVMELRAQYLLKLGRKEEAEKVYSALIRRNQEYRAYYRGLQAAKGISDSDNEGLLTLYGECSKKYPKADAPRRIPLDFLTGDDFRGAADEYLRRMLNRGVPSTFNNVKALYTDHSKQKTIQELVEGYHKDQASTAVNGANSSVSDKSAVDFEAGVLFFLAQHYNYHSSRDLKKASEFIKQAIARNDKSVDFRMTKARIYKHGGNISQAAEAMNDARLNDERDRYINTKTAKYQLRNNENGKALETMSKFTRQDAAGGPFGDLAEMQSVWFLTEEAESYLRQNRLGLALKRLNVIYNIFDLWQDDQFDFHNYAYRTKQIRAYVDMIRWEDGLRSHPYYTRVAIAATKVYLFLHDKPDLAREILPNGVNGEHKDANEKKKAARKARKEKERQEQLAAEKKDAKKAAGGSTADEQKQEDKDPEGKLLLETKDPLGDALRFLMPMLESSPRNLEAQKLGFEVFIRRKKYLLALRCLLNTKSAAPDSPIYHSQLLRLQHAITHLSYPLHSNIAAVFATEFRPLFQNDSSSSPDLKALNDAFLSENSSAEAVFAGAEVRRTIDESSGKQIENDFVEVVKKEKTTLEDALKGLEMLRYWDLDVKEYIEAARERWTEANAFAAGKEA